MRTRARSRHGRSRRGAPGGASGHGFGRGGALGRGGVLGRGGALVAASLAGVVGACFPAAVPAAASLGTFHSGYLHSGYLHSDQTWGGYGLTGTTFSSIAGAWTVPTLNCSAGSGSVSPWIGIDGWSNGTVEQIGLDLDCSSGGQSFHPWVEMYPAPSVYFTERVLPGDVIVASISVSGTLWSLTETDPAQHWAKTFHLTSRDARASAEAVVEDLGSSSTPPPVDDFGTVTFRNLTVNGHPFFSAGAVNVSSLERGTTQLSRSVKLSLNSCSVTWLHR